MITLMIKYLGYLSNSKSKTDVKMEMILLWNIVWPTSSISSHFGSRGTLPGQSVWGWQW